MKLRPRKTLEYYYITALCLTLALLIAGGLYQWKTGALNLSNIASTYEAELALEDIKKEQSPQKIDHLVVTDRATEAINLINDQMISTQKIESSFSVSSYRELAKSQKQAQAGLKQLISYPRQEMIFSVLTGKIDSFKSFVSSRNWQTLTRMSTRTRSRLSARSLRSSNFFTDIKLRSFSKLLKADITSMMTITDSSVLSSLDKSDIKKRLSGLLVELTMLENYALALRKLRGGQNNLKTSFNNWIKEVAPSITVKTLELEKTSHNIKIAFLALVVLLACFIALGIFLNKKNEESTLIQNEKNIIDIITNGLFPLESKLNCEDFREDFQREFESKREYFHRRISFGSVFQEAIPFSSILLDSNLHVTWANDLFYTEWDLLDKKQGGVISWDYLSQYTNLGEDDPIQMALNSNLAGIYQVQVKSPKNHEKLPFEMYVSPVEYSGQKRIMVFFYPLRNMEEIITNQVKSIVGPVGRTLESMADQKFQGAEKDKLQKDFEVAGIDDLFDKFESFDNKMNDFHQGLFNEIEDLEKHYYEQVTLVNTFQEKLKDRLEIGEEMQNVFKGCQQEVITVVDLRSEILQSFDDYMELTRQTLKSQKSLLETSMKNKHAFDENMQAQEKMGLAKDQIKEIKEYAEERAGKLQGLVEQSILTIKRNNLDPRMESALTDIRSEIKVIQKLLGDFTQGIRSLDVMMSKVEMLNANSDASDLNYYSENMSEFETAFEHYSSIKNEFSLKTEDSDHRVVDQFKELFTTYKSLASIDRTSMALGQDLEQEQVAVLNQDMAQIAESTPETSLQ